MPDAIWADDFLEQREPDDVTMPDGRDLGEALVSAGLARPYDRGQRQSWCTDQWR
jgi:endonuclease YncB( thermonuclease family)